MKLSILLASSLLLRVSHAAVSDCVMVDTSTGQDIMVLKPKTVLDIKKYGTELTVRCNSSNSVLEFDLNRGQMVRLEPKNVDNESFCLTGLSQDNTMYSSYQLAKLGIQHLRVCPHESVAQAGRRRHMQEAPIPGCLEFEVHVVQNSDSQYASASVAASPDYPNLKADMDGQINGQLMAHHRVTLGFTGPPASETGTTVPGQYRAPTPFPDYKFEVTFVKGSKSYKVPGFFAGDGKAHNTGSVSGHYWGVHFVPPQAGTYSWTASFRQGTNVAQEGGGNPGAFFDGASGSFTVEPSDKTDVFHSKGRLFAGNQYLEFADGTPFCGAGPDSPQNLFQYNDFDGSAVSKTYLHTADFDQDDAFGFTFAGGKGHALLGALKYLAKQGVNTLTVTTLNDDIVHPFKFKDNVLTYDLSKLGQWTAVLEYACKLGISVRLKLEENDSLFSDNGALSMERKLYLREMVSRFGHVGGLVWDLGEGLSASQASERASFLKSIDPYDTPIVVRTESGALEQLDDVDGVGLHTEVYSDVYGMVTSSVAKGWMVSSVQQGDLATGVQPDVDDPNHDTIRQEVLWGAIMAGATTVQYHFGASFAQSDTTLTDFGSRENLWRQTRVALNFVSTYGLTTMKPCAVPEVTWCLENDTTQVIYKKAGATWPNSILGSMLYFDPRTGALTFSHNVEQDWVAVVNKV